MKAPFSLVSSQPSLPVEFDDPARTLFEFWRVMMRHERAQFGPKRRKAVEAAMSWGYSLDDLRLAVIGCRCSPRNMGENEERAVYDDLELIVRDEAHIDRFIRLGEAKVKQLIERERAEKESAEAPAPSGMPAAIRAKMDALFTKAKAKS